MEQKEFKNIKKIVEHVANIPVAQRVAKSLVVVFVTEK